MAANEPECRVESAGKMKVAMAPAQMCRSFQDQLAEDIGSKADLSDIRVVLKVDGAHSVEATITTVSGEQSQIVSPITVEVLDRPVNLRDIRSLATSVGHALLNQNS